MNAFRQLLITSDSIYCAHVCSVKYGYILPYDNDLDPLEYGYRLTEDSNLVPNIN